MDQAAQQQDENQQTNDPQLQTIKKPRNKAQLHNMKPEIIAGKPEKRPLIDLYNKMKNKTFQKDEIEELNQFMRVIEEWHYQVMPRYDFTYFVDRLQKFGSESLIRTQLEMMRKAHVGLIPWEFLTTSVEEQENQLDTIIPANIQSSNNKKDFDTQSQMGQMQPQQNNNYNTQFTQSQNNTAKKGLKIKVRPSGQKNLSSQFDEADHQSQQDFQEAPQQVQPQAPLYDGIEAAFQMRQEKKGIKLKKTM